MSRSSDCDVWKKVKEVMKIKVTQRLTYHEARKVYEQHKPEFTFSKVVSASQRNPKQKQLQHNTVKKILKLLKAPKLLSYE